MPLSRTVTRGMLTTSAIEASGVPGIVLNGIHSSVVPDANEVVSVDACANVTIVKDSNDITRQLSMIASLFSTLNGVRWGERGKVEQQGRMSTKRLEDRPGPVAKVHGNAGTA